MVIVNTILLHDMINRRVVLFVVCVYILRGIRSADCVELPVFLYLLQCLVPGVSHAIQNEKRLWNLHIG